MNSNISGGSNQIQAYFSLNDQTSIQVWNQVSKNRCLCDLFRWSAKGDDLLFVAGIPH